MSNLALDKQLCFKIYSLNKILVKLYAPLLKELGLTYPQYLVMLVLWENKEAMTIKQIGHLLDLDTGTLSPLLKRMETNNLISRQRSKADERTVFVTLTNEGKELEPSASKIPEKLFLLTGLSVDDMSSLKGTLHNLIETTKNCIN